jgi:hypothetical protein
MKQNCVEMTSKVISIFCYKVILPLLGAQNLFCRFLECKIYFAASWSAKFILPLFFVPNFVCSPLLVNVIWQTAKIDNALAK